MARVDLAGADVVFICQAAEQVLGVAHELGAARRGLAVGPVPSPQGSGFLFTVLGAA